MKQEGEPLFDHLANKYGRATATNFVDPKKSRVMDMGRAVGIEFNNDRLVVDTKRAHALVEYIKQEKKDNDQANELMLDLYKAYFEQGQDINDVDLLVDMAKKFSLQEEEARAAMGRKHLDDVVSKDRETKAAYGVNGVPFFVVNDDVTFSGAYPIHFIAKELKRAAASSSPAAETHDNGDEN
mmetsp:Transcript_10520/g.16047  ORF Transcript_10520/g.16047 Transcript_10520/m.16047 type:complete len:183 (+) Transcript_10520:202-750(+)|eukprot:CAMPEP_0118698726 /NCGR_PEP_ID=MMETSP0800-20121206/15398_1 /TAXON_ID=210618 ORGANISM="Striatella unipunctata, Strain CCMP2910" /NCGR_SAMPLE_ID=MMETSP0800 /ASSEMBLY_ACC=CAM_ASM_000638 /LENGTH=182 /DNA_ID=CAMNT_0006598653 /DNA_START=216 /DNA_END=764 /DNA_ORIENTATION=+